ncbi:hypothetical protein, partial [Sphingobium psychrophilum]|uniref:hypothetical protein n=1 Tax=Sphingobium psychrophilum TaxID=2728834 RepID=UPI0019D12DEC
IRSSPVTTRETDRPLQRLFDERASGQLRYPQNLHHAPGHDQAVFACRALVRHELAMEQQWEGTAKHGSANLSRAGR